MVLPRFLRFGRPVSPKGLEENFLPGVGGRELSVRKKVASVMAIALVGTSAEQSAVDAFGSLGQSCGMSYAAVQGALHVPVSLARGVMGLIPGEEPSVTRNPSPTPLFSDTAVTSFPDAASVDVKVALPGVNAKADAAGASTDGDYLGLKQSAYSPAKYGPADIPELQGTTGPLVYYVSGMETAPSTQIYEAALLSNRIGAHVLPIENSPKGTGQVITTEKDRIGSGDSAAATTLANANFADLEAGKDVNDMGYSQGGAIVSHALHLLEDKLDKAGDKDLLSRVNVVLVAGAGKNFPVGPHYTSYVNNEDPVPNWLGIHQFKTVESTVNYVLDGVVPSLNVPQTSGLDARIVTFDDHGQANDCAFGQGSAHGINTYVNHIPVGSEPVEKK